MEDERLTPAERATRNAIRNFSIRTLHHDPIDPEQGQRPPYILLEFVDDRMDAREGRKKIKGMLLAAVCSAVVALLVGKWEWVIQRISGSP